MRRHDTLAREARKEGSDHLGVAFVMSGLRLPPIPGQNNEYLALELGRLE
jgi:hypothetical protein